MIEFSGLENKKHKKLLKVTNGALKSAINAHGPVTNYWIGSASKRIVGAIKSYLADTNQEKECDCGRV